MGRSKAWSAILRPGLSGVEGTDLWVGVENSEDRGHWGVKGQLEVMP